MTNPDNMLRGLRGETCTQQTPLYRGVFAGLR